MHPLDQVSIIYNLLGDNSIQEIIMSANPVIEVNENNNHDRHLVMQRLSEIIIQVDLGDFYK